MKFFCLKIIVIDKDLDILGALLINFGQFRIKIDIFDYFIKKLNDL